MPVRKTEALKLRVRGYSYNEIHAKLGIPKATLSDWFSNLVLPQEAQQRLRKRVRQGTLNGLVRRNKMQTRIAQERAHQTRSDAMNEIPTLDRCALLLVGAALYWGEGHKKPIVYNGRERTWHAVNFTNADPDMIRMYMRFVREVLEVSDQDVRINLRLFPHSKESTARTFWSKVTGLPESHFQKTTRVISKSSEGKRNHNLLPHGTIQVRINDTPKYHRIMGWIDGLARQGK